ncbi:MAG: MFS transporter [Deltaproteobacteria bacterium]
MSLGKYKEILKSFGFQSFLWTQFFGAFNDNVFKIVLSMIAVNMAGSSGGGYVSLVGAVFILPFFLFSGYAGYFADKYSKTTVLIVTKSFEIVAAVFGTFALLSGKIEYMLVTLFLMATHSTFFSPAKYGILPEMLPEKELSRANGVLEMSTFLAIILGTAAGTFMFAAWKDSLVIIGGIMIVVAVAGTAMSFGISRVKASGADKTLVLNPWSEIGHGIAALKKDSFLLLAVASITYFWFLGALLQMDILLLGKEVMKLSDTWIGILITFLAVGIGIGSLTAGRLSGDKVEPGLVPIGSIGMGIVAVLLAFSSASYVRVAVCLVLLGFFGGLFIVPMNALLQHRSGGTEKGRLIATTNFIGTASILVASGVLWGLRDLLGVMPDRIVFVFGIITMLCTIAVIKALPQFLLRFSLWFLTHTFYKIRIAGKENVPSRGAALLVCNHLSFIDGLLVGACVHRFIRFMIYRYFYEHRALNWALRHLHAIPVSDGDKKDIMESIKAARKELEAGHVVCVFAEGAISRTGNLLPFKKGLERIVEGLDVPVIPVHLDRVWGSIFSFKGGSFFWKLPSAFMRRVTVSFGRALPSSSRIQQVRAAVMELGSEAVKYRRSYDDCLHLRFIKAAKSRLNAPCMADDTGVVMTWGKAANLSLAASGPLKRALHNQEMVGILAEPGAYAAIANIAAHTAGKIPVNISTSASESAIASIREQCGISTIITTRPWAAKAKREGKPGYVCIEDVIAEAGALGRFLARLAAWAFSYRAIAAIYCKGKTDPFALATIIFTGYHEGEPRGVRLTHHNVLSNIEGFSQLFNMSGKDALLSALPFYHSFGYTVGLWYPLINGLTARYCSSEANVKAATVFASAPGAAMLIGTPSFYLSLSKDAPPEALSTIRYAVTGGVRLSETTARIFRNRFGKPLLEGYGSTEIGPVLSVNVPDVEEKGIRQTGKVEGTVGHPIPGITVKVVSPESGEELQSGMEGVLLVKGPSVSDGYWKNPEKTVEALHKGWFSTGVIASVGDDGFIRVSQRLVSARAAE